jgi:hypothetical protein
MFGNRGCSTWYFGPPSTIVTTLPPCTLRDALRLKELIDACRGSRSPASAVVPHLRVLDGGPDPRACRYAGRVRVANLGDTCDRAARGTASDTGWQDPFPLCRRPYTDSPTCWRSRVLSPSGVRDRVDHDVGGSKLLVFSRPRRLST